MSLSRSNLRTVSISWDLMLQLSTTPPSVQPLPLSAGSLKLSSFLQPCLQDISALESFTINSIFDTIRQNL